MSARQSRRRFLSLLALSSGAAALAACAGAASPTAVPARPAAAGGAATPAGAPAVAKTSGEISWWTMETQIEAEKKVLDEGANQFKQLSGATVRIQYVPWGDAFGKYVASLEANTPPDAGQHSHVTPPSFAARGVLEPAGDVVKAIGEADFIDAAHQVVKGKDGTFWGVPWFFEMRTLWYWKDMFEEAGVKAPLATWSDWLDALKKLTKPDRQGIAIRASKGWGQYWSSLAVANGGPMIQKDGKITVDTPEHLQALRWWTDLHLLHKVTPPGTPQHDQPAAQQLFLKRQVAMLWDNATVMDLTLKQSPENKEKLGVMHVPEPTKPGATGLHFLGGSSLMLFKASKNKDAAKEWTRFLHDKEFAGRFFKAQVVNVPNRKSLVDDPYFKEPWKQTYITAGEKATFYGYTQEQSPYIVVLQTAEGSKVFAATDEQVFGGFMSADQSLKDTQKKVEDIKTQVT